jgi:AsmA protein
VEPEIEGPVRLTLLPRPAVRLEGVRLNDGSRPTFVAGALQATVEILPLLSGQVMIGSLTFEQPQLSVEFGSEGDLLVGMPLQPRGAKEPLARPEIRFVDGTVRIRSTGSGHIEPLTAVDAALAWSGAGLTATGSFQWRSTPASASLSIADTAALGRGDRSGFRVRLDAEPLKIAFEGGLAYRNGIQAGGTLSADAKSLRDALSLFAVPPLTRGGFGPFKLKGQAALTGNSLAITGLSIELDGNRAEGGLTAKYANGRTVVQATLASETSDFTPYSGGFTVSDDDGRDWSREPIDLAALESFDADVRLSSALVIVRKSELRRVAATMSLRSGGFTLSIGDAQFHGGTLRGRASVARQASGEPSVKIEATMADFDLSTGLPTISGVQRLEGKGTLAVALEGSGRHVQAITQGLSGTITLAAKDGAFNGINVEQVLRRLEQKPLGGTSDLLGGRTPFNRLTAKLKVAGGKANIEEAQFESALVRVKLAGEASIVHRDYDLRGTAALVRGATGGKTAEPFDLPFVVLGSWDRPFVLPDPSTLIQRSDAAAPLLEAVRKQTAREKAAEQPTPASAPAGQAR